MCLSETFGPRGKGVPARMRSRVPGPRNPFFADDASLELQWRAMAVWLNSLYDARCGGF